ncbi:HAMP domain-containing sensor histidine kinase [Bacillus tropicus]|nr:MULTISPECIES: HAMP domain-containing sensor histidine kinase [Bacillus]MCC1485863.1 HAMP domain-containing histidine kinase [Bacillus tropicus]MDA1552538.1 HAMP domain-containing sensor histidine kinase [Bacillus cereus group sp. TH243-3LC]MDA1563197.1 HAMP domain-containing sensor histidine kinase [Bacillus cereus group sp. TH243-1LC]MDA1657354.1 HAMP domain-containing sensor histidine kinase [Bacillus cereus group sp. TH150LC]MDA1860404.1 HAMP domain-containing sensor histidine kinase [Ba
MIKNFSIKKQIITGFLVVLFGSIILTIITFVCMFSWWMNGGSSTVHPADYYQNKIPIIENYAKEKGENLLKENEQSSLEKLIPTEGIKYQIINEKGIYYYGNITESIINKENPLVKNINLKINGKNNVNNITYYIPLCNNNGELKGSLVLNYNIAVSATSFLDFIPIVLLFLSPFIYITILSYLISNKIGKRISKPITDLIAASHRIKDKDLDFHIEYDANNEVGELVQAFEKMRAELENSLSREWALREERREYINAISHDLKTPLTIVKGHAEGLQSGMWRNEELLLRYLSTIESNANRMAKLLSEFNMINELEVRSFNLFLVNSEIEYFLKRRIMEYNYLMEKKNIYFSFEIKNDKQIKNFILDQERISQVIDNIIMNSIRFTPDNGKIHVTVCINTKQLQFHIVDSGPGFEPKDISKIFNQFYQGDPSRSKNKSHSGLGLYIAKTIIEKHQGEIHADNNSKYGGAHIWFIIPN